MWFWRGRQTLLSTAPLRTLVYPLLAEGTQDDPETATTAQLRHGPAGAVLATTDEGEGVDGDERVNPELGVQRRANVERPGTVDRTSITDDVEPAANGQPLTQLILDERTRVPAEAHTIGPDRLEGGHEVATELDAEARHRKVEHEVRTTAETDHEPAATRDALELKIEGPTGHRARLLELGDLSRVLCDRGLELADAGLERLELDLDLIDLGDELGDLDREGAEGVGRVEASALIARRDGGGDPLADRLLALRQVAEQGAEARHAVGAVEAVEDLEELVQLLDVLGEEDTGLRDAVGGAGVLAGDLAAVRDDPDRLLGRRHRAAPGRQVILSDGATTDLVGRLLKGHDLALGLADVRRGHRPRVPVPRRDGLVRGTQDDQTEVVGAAQGVGGGGGREAGEDGDDKGELAVHDLFSSEKVDVSERSSSPNFTMKLEQRMNDSILGNSFSAPYFTDYWWVGF